MGIRFVFLAPKPQPLRYCVSEMQRNFGLA